MSGRVESRFVWAEWMPAGSEAEQVHEATARRLDDLVADISVDLQPFRDAMEVTAGALRALIEGISAGDAEVLGALHIAAAGMSGAEAGRRMREWALSAAPYAVSPPTVAPEDVDDSIEFDLDPGRCWKCDAKPGVEELDGACWRCWYKLTGSTKARAT